MRTSLTGAGQINVGGLAYSAAFALVSLIGGLIVFRMTERKFADVI